MFLSLFSFSLFFSLSVTNSLFPLSYLVLSSFILAQLQPSFFLNSPPIQAPSLYHWPIFGICVYVSVWVSGFVFVFQCGFWVGFRLCLCFWHGFWFRFMYQAWVLAFFLCFGHGFLASQFVFQVGFLLVVDLWVSICGLFWFILYGFLPIALIFFIPDFSTLLFCSSSLVFDGYWLEWWGCDYAVFFMALIVVVVVFWLLNEILFYYSVYIILLY